jgi:NADP-dependent 3-hydroxy acid dehydrogenase YdfG
MPGIKDEVVVITGASSGIGEATAVILAERGAKVVLGARGLDRLEALARRIAGAGKKLASYLNIQHFNSFSDASRFPVVVMVSCLVPQ